MPTEVKTPKQTLVEEGTEFKGTLKSTCPVVINGTIDGEVEAPEITVARAGTVAGSLKANKLRSQGTLSGKVEATDVYLSGVVRSNTSIKAKRLEVKLGSEQAQIEVNFGECSLEVGEAEPLSASTPTKSETAVPELKVADAWGATETNELGTTTAGLSSNVTPPALPGSITQGNGTQGNGNRSPWKPSRAIEANPIEAKPTTLR
jgi:cytoskeletal protein CcmA (bactofilin family)